MALNKNEKKMALEKAKKYIGLSNEQVNKNFSVEDIKELKYKCLVQLATRSTEGIRNSTEFVKSYLLNNYNFYTLMNKSEDLWVYLDGIYQEVGELVIKKFCSDIYEEAYTESIAKEVINKVKAQTFIPKDDFIGQNPKHRVCLMNGIYDLRLNNLYPHNPDEFHFNKLPIVFDEFANCDKIIDFWKSILHNPKEDLLVMQELCGWLLWKEYKPERAVMFYGEGRNGKGKTLTILQRFLGKNNYSNVSLTQLDGTTNQYSPSILMNKMANFGGDIADTDFKDTSILRGLSGNDSIDAPRKYKDNIQFTNYAKLFFACNKPPRVYDDHEGFWNRWLWIKFPYTFLSKKDYEARNGDSNPYYKIRDENIVDGLVTPAQLSGLFNWALIGLKRLQYKQDFSQEATSIQIKKEWARKADPFVGFCMDHICSYNGSYIEKEELRRAFNVYCKKNNFKGVSDRSIKSTMSELFGSTDSRPLSDDGKQVLAWSNVCFKFARLGVSKRFSYSVFEHQNVLEQKYIPKLKDFFNDNFINADGSIFKQLLIDTFGISVVESALVSGELVEIKPNCLVYGW